MVSLTDGLELDHHRAVWLDLTAAAEGRSSGG
jgi:hypothetical protein